MLPLNMAIKKCLICNKEFYAKPRDIKRGFAKFCSKLHYDQWQKNSGYHKGNKSPRWNSIKRICKICNREFFASPSRIANKRGIYCSKKCYSLGMKGLKRKKMSKETIAKFSGKNHYNWKGGINYEYRKRFKTPEWEIIKKIVYKRDNRTCQKCGKKCNYMDISCHHIEPWRISKNDNLNNLITLCRSCHAKEDLRS